LKGTPADRVLCKAAVGAGPRATLRGSKVLTQDGTSIGGTRRHQRGERDSKDGLPRTQRYGTDGLGQIYGFHTGGRKHTLFGDGSVRFIKQID